MNNDTLYHQLNALDDSAATGVPVSEYERQKCLCFRIAYFPIAKIRIIEHWKADFFVPLSSALFFLVTLCLFLYDTWRTYPTARMRALSVSITCAAFLFAILSFVLTIATDPGYLPYNWALTRKRSYTWEEMMSNLVIFKKQSDSAATMEKPLRSCFSRSAGRIVLRADHFCSWTKTWIGLKNHRFFMLMCFWIVVYCLCNFGFRYHFWVSLFTSKFNWKSVFGLLTVLCLLYFCFFASYQLVISVINLSRNMTLLEKWKNSPNEYDTGCLNNFAEVCGRKSLCPLWLFPFFCFRPISDGFYDVSTDSFSPTPL